MLPFCASTSLIPLIMEAFFQPRKVSIDYSVSHLTACVTSGLPLEPTVRGILNRGAEGTFLSKRSRWSVSKRMMYLEIKWSAFIPSMAKSTAQYSSFTPPYFLTRSSLLPVSCGWFDSYWFYCALTNSSILCLAILLSPGKLIDCLTVLYLSDSLRVAGAPIYSSCTHHPLY